MAKRKVKVWGKINLFETSAVGIASYPDAHFSEDSFSLLKALSNTGFRGETEKIEKEEVDMTEETKTETTESETEESESSETEEKSEESEESEEEAAPEEPSEKKGEVTIEKIAEIVQKTVKAEVEKLGPERGLVVTDQKELQKELETKSIGELAVMTGLFKP